MQLHRIIAAAALSLVAGLANAAPVTFNFQAVVDYNDPAGGTFDPALNLGNTISISVTFDSAATYYGTTSDSFGNPRLVFDPSSISMTLSGGSYTETRAFASTGGGLLYVRDGMSNPDCGRNINQYTTLCGPVDGISFLIYSADGLSYWNVILRGTILDLITNNALPTLQDDRWVNQEIRGFYSCSTRSSSSTTCDLGELGATIVPEPGTLALLGLGLAGLGFARRRKTA
ncbi:MAG: PEP-CTERM sorting domain-containing protein [Steroidobacteraceae bacterium]|nr:PEP-CTERM sorting domain-containing protein [Steroidobacteraceae bacterium]